MRALIMDGFEEPTVSSERLGAAMEPELERWGLEVLRLPVARMRVHSCRGCFDCWLKTPGTCRMKDDFHTVARAYLQSDVAIFWSPVIFGTYGAGMKRVLERFIGIMTPFFRRSAGEIHHPPRYDANPSIYAVGWLTKEDPAWAELFTRLAARNAANLLAPHSGAVTLADECDWPMVVDRLHTFVNHCVETE